MRICHSAIIKLMLNGDIYHSTEDHGHVLEVYSYVVFLPMLTAYRGLRGCRRWIHDRANSSEVPVRQAAKGEKRLM